MRLFFGEETARPPRGAVVARRNERNTPCVRKRHKRVNSVADGRGKTHKWGGSLALHIVIFSGRRSHCGSFYNANNTPINYPKGYIPSVCKI